MEALKSELQLERIETSDQIDFLNGSVFLWVIHANKVPPHVGISKGDAFFSLKANGKDAGIPLNRILKVLQAKEIATLFYEIDPKAANLELENAFNRYERTVSNEITCLQPLKDIFGDEQSVKVIDMLSFLEDQDVLVNQYGWKLPEQFDGIPAYELSDIHNRLKSLEND